VVTGNKRLTRFKKQAVELIPITKEKDIRTLRYDWFLSTDGTEANDFVTPRAEFTSFVRAPTSAARARIITSCACAPSLRCRIGDNSSGGTRWSDAARLELGAAQTTMRLVAAMENGRRRRT